MQLILGFIKVAPRKFWNVPVDIGQDVRQDKRFFVVLHRGEKKIGVRLSGEDKYFAVMEIKSVWVGLKVVFEHKPIEVVAKLADVVCLL